jgi:primosomal protein N' (replication factor Y)
MQELARELPELRCLRYDSDTTRAKGAHRALMSRFAQGEADVLVGTQMLTKGIDLPQVTLVGVIAADGLLHLADYRASERSYQTLTQVAGRSGRGDDPGQVIIQTYNPDHPVIQAVQRQDYQAFVDAELQLRQAFHYPPTARLILLRLSSPDAGAVETTARHVAEILHQKAAEHPHCQVLGPAPAPILRIANRYRWQILLKQWHEGVPSDGNVGGDRSTHRLPVLLEVEALRSHCPSAVNLTIDIDPLYLS